VTERSVAKELNTVAEPWVDVAGEVAQIRAGSVPSVNGHYTVNGRVYGIHNSSLYPVSGPGFHQLNRGAYKALGMFNKFGDTAQARSYIASMKNVGVTEIEAALAVWRKIQ
jgi:hypothetical protein